jgi:hypothetical protein
MIRVLAAATFTVAGATLVVADEVRRIHFADALFGSWAPSAEACTKDDKSKIEISNQKYAGPEGNCAVRWIVETAAAAGTNYSVHAFCTDPEKPAESKVTDFIIRRQPDGRIAVGKSFDSLKPYQRCDGAK